MNNYIRWKKHAYIRFQERSCLPFKVMQGILLNEQYVPIGKETGKSREHILFYSIRDQYHYIIVRDYKTNEVITFLPYEYHQNLAWKISQETLDEAQKIAHKPHRQKESKVIDQPIEKEPTVKPKKKYDVVCIYWDNKFKSNSFKMGKYYEHILFEEVDGKRTVSRQLFGDVKGQFKKQKIRNAVLQSFVIEDIENNEFINIEIYYPQLSSTK